MPSPSIRVSVFYTCVYTRSGIGDGDEVIIPSFAFIAVENAVRYKRSSSILSQTRSIWTPAELSL